MYRQLDAAVWKAYGWPHDLNDEEILARLLALNVQRAAVQDGRVLSLEQSEAAVEQGEIED